MAITAMSTLGGGNNPVDMSIYSIGDQLLLKNHLHRLLTLKIMIIIWPLVCILSIIMLWVGYIKDYGPLYYWWLFYQYYLAFCYLFSALDSKLARNWRFARRIT